MTDLDADVAVHRSVRQRPLRVGVEPPGKLVDGDQQPAAAADDAQLAHDVVLEEVDADAERLGGLDLRHGQTRDPAVLGIG